MRKKNPVHSSNLGSARKKGNGNRPTWGKNIERNWLWFCFYSWNTSGGCLDILNGGQSWLAADVSAENPLIWVPLKPLFSIVMCFIRSNLVLKKRKAKKEDMDWPCRRSWGRSRTWALGWALRSDRWRWRTKRAPPGRPEAPAPPWNGFSARGRRHKTMSARKHKTSAAGKTLKWIWRLKMGQEWTMH